MTVWREVNSRRFFFSGGFPACPCFGLGGMVMEEGEGSSE